MSPDAASLNGMPAWPSGRRSHERTVADGVRRALNSGIGHEREWVRFWTAIREGDDGS
jgi:hypothetical protein